MTTLTIRIPDDTAARLRELARHRGISLNKLMEEFSATGLAEFDTETRFRLGNPASGISALALGFLLPNAKVEQLAATRLTTPQDAIASLLQRLVRHCMG